MRHNSKKMAFDEGGAIAPLFGILLIPLIGMLGAAVDFGSAMRIRAIEQTVSDQTALLVADAETPAAASERFDFARQELVRKLGARSDQGGFQISGRWLDGANYRLTISTSMKTSFVHLLPGTSRAMDVGVSTTVIRVAPTYETKPPALSQLSPEAADYNRLYFYCYSSSPERQKEADAGRRGITPIADNATPATNYASQALPTCGQNEAPSTMLRNVRNARTSPGKWDDKHQEVYEYYTDVVIDTGSRAQTMNMKGFRVTNGTVRTAVDMRNNPIVETIVCDSLSACRSRSDGGVLPNSHVTHDPATASVGCEEGKYMYYGWEDRPPNAGSDRDYDDIRLLMSCPKLVKVSDKKIRIVE
ncbi:hypothetical protein FF100_35655 [Methylobacterium terricola]|uniref:Putative Flp pilus-assembly TadG-like N-terminal domain-containing protein n=1 Tax=Methylobacterium terricola TaxID=2583531 RepID=A0A5C4L7M4_9HYPH|nr:TadE/TadG family type IV pilus assembly protein [Methylobacterium terricola]TNC05448.1 hypothetical protein FF100_35655 [Methylobacterium terricola]